MAKSSFVVGLLGDTIGGSLAKPLVEGEGDAQGVSLAYRLVDGQVTGLRPGDTGDVLRWATQLGFDGMAVTHPFKNAALAVADHDPAFVVTVCSDRMLDPEYLDRRLEAVVDHR